MAKIVQRSQNKEQEGSHVHKAFENNCWNPNRHKIKLDTFTMKFRYNHVEIKLLTMFQKISQSIFIRFISIQTTIKFLEKYAL